MNYRLEGLSREADEIATRLKDGGLMNCDLEVIGALLFTKYKGEDARIEGLFTNTSTLLKDAEALLERLRNKNDDTNERSICKSHSGPSFKRAGVL